MSFGSLFDVLLRDQRKLTPEREIPFLDGQNSGGRQKEIFDVLDILQVLRVQSSGHLRFV